jgi:hypothetical protein
MMTTNSLQFEYLPEILTTLFGAGESISLCIKLAQPNEQSVCVHTPLPNEGLKNVRTYFVQFSTPFI